MKHRVADLDGALLDAAVAKALGHRDLQLKNGEWRSRTEDGELSPIAAFSKDWAAGGLIIEQEYIELRNIQRGLNIGREIWGATIKVMVAWDGPGSPHHHCSGPTPLIAAMRTFVTSKFGQEVDL